MIFRAYLQNDINPVQQPQIYCDDWKDRPEK